jgi:hypothetical protein
VPESFVDKLKMVEPIRYLSVSFRGSDQMFTPRSWRVMFSTTSNIEGIDIKNVAVLVVIYNESVKRKHINGMLMRQMIGRGNRNFASNVFTSVSTGHVFSFDVIDENPMMIEYYRDSIINRTKTSSRYINSIIEYTSKHNLRNVTISSLIRHMNPHSNELIIEAVCRNTEFPSFEIKCLHINAVYSIVFPNLKQEKLNSIFACLSTLPHDRKLFDLVFPDKAPNSMFPSLSSEKYSYYETIRKNLLRESVENDEFS